ncbi:hypothetical protein OC844_002177 [Tilletia horrida]|nr:hypothetical protein OC844_002177 [Tilletia horrida]
MVLPAAFSTGSERPSDRIQEWCARVFRATGHNERPLPAALGQPRGHAHDPLWTCHGIDVDYGPRVRLFFKWAKWRFEDRDWTHRPKAELIRFVEQLLELGLTDLPESHNDMVRNTDADGEVKACELHGHPPSTIGVSAETDSTIYIPPLAPGERAPPAAGPSAPGPAPAGSAPDPAVHGPLGQNGGVAELDELDELDELEQGGEDDEVNEHRDGGLEDGVAGGDNSRAASGGGQNMHHAPVSDNDDDIDSVDSVSSGDPRGVADDDEHDADNASDMDDAAVADAVINEQHAGDADSARVEGDEAHEEGHGNANMNARMDIGGGASVGAQPIEEAAVPQVAESVHRFSPSLGGSARSASVVWVAGPQVQAALPEPAPPARSGGPAGPSHAASSGSTAPRAALISDEDDLPPSTLALFGSGNPADSRGAMPARSVDNAPLAGPSRPAASAAGLPSAFGFRLPPPDVTSSPPPFRSVPSASSLRRAGVTTYFGQPASFSQPASTSHRPRTPLRDTQAPAAPPPRKRAKRARGATKGAPLKQNSGQSLD